MVTTTIRITNEDKSKKVQVTDEGSTYLVSTLVNLINQDLAMTKGLPFGIVLESAPAAVLATSYNIILSPGSTYDLQVRKVTRYNVTYKGDTNPATNNVTVDYIPGSQPNYGQPNALSSLVTAFADKFSLSGGVYGIRFTSPSDSTIISSSDAYPDSGTYTLIDVQRYTVVFDASKTTVQKDYEFKQDAKVLLSLRPTTASTFVYPVLYPNNITEATIETAKAVGILDASTYMVKDTYDYYIKVPKDTFAVDNPKVDNTYHLYKFATQTAANIVKDLGDGSPLTFTAGSYTLLDTDTGANVTNIQPTIAAGKYTLARMYTFVDKYTVDDPFDTSVDITGLAKQTVADLLQHPALNPQDDAIPANQMLTFMDASSGDLVPMDTLLEDLSDLLTADTVYSKALGYTLIHVGWKDQVMDLKVPLGGTFGSVKALALAFFGLEENADLHYNLFEKLVTYKSRADAALPEATSTVVDYVFREMRRGQVLGTSGSTVQAYLPVDFNYGEMRDYLVDFKASVPISGTLTIASLAANQVYVVANAGTDITPGLPFVNVFSVNPTLNLRVYVQASSSVTLIVPEVEINKDLGAISVKHTGKQMIDWALYLAPGMNAGTVRVASSRDDTTEPAYAVIAGESPILAAYTATVTRIYVKEGTHVTIDPVDGDVSKRQIDTWLPWDFSGYDVISYAKTQFALSDRSYVFYALADSLKEVVGPQDVLQNIYIEFPADPLKLKLRPTKLTQVTAAYNSTSYPLRLVSDECTMRQVFDDAAVKIGLPAGVQLEATDSGILDSDALSKYSKVGLTNSDPKIATFDVRVRALNLVVLYNSDSHQMVFNQKVSSQILPSQVIDMYRAKKSIHPSATFELSLVSAPSIPIDMSKAVANYTRDYNKNSDADKVPEDGLAEVTRIVEFELKSTTQQLIIIVQNLLNMGTPAKITIPAFSSLDELAYMAKQSFGLKVGTFALADSKDLTKYLDGKDVVQSAIIYRLIETTVPKRYVVIHQKFRNRSDNQADIDKVYDGLTLLSQMDNVNVLFDELRETAEGTVIVNTSQSIATWATPNAERNIFVVQKPNISVSVTYNNKVTVLDLPVRTLFEDLGSKLDIQVGISVVETATGKQISNLSDAIVKYSAPYMFTVNAVILQRNIEIMYGGQTKTIQVKDGNSVSEVLAIASTAFGITRSVSLSVDGLVSLSQAQVPNFVKNSKFIMLDAVPLSSLAIGGLIAILAANATGLIALF